jgi:BirA family biotin operon repressor/biotin-[acetyl-CoA-carboxylase] ligase
MSIQFKTVELNTVDSTNRYAMDNFSDLPDCCLITAECQTQGRGRRGRTWISPAGENLYASFLIKNFDLPVYQTSWLGSLAVLNVLRKLDMELDVWLKWPNDIYCGSRKIAGILCEVKTDSSNHPLGVIIGIGLNLNMSVEALNSIDQPATSVQAESGLKVNVKKIINLLGIELSGLYSSGSLSGSRGGELYRIWKKENILVGKTVEVITDAGRTLTGEVSDIAPSGELILTTEEGVLSFYSGDVSIKKAEKIHKNR